MADTATTATTTEMVEKVAETTTPETEQFDKNRAMALIEKLRAENRDLSKSAKKAAEYEAAAKVKAEGEMSELQKAQAKLAEYETKIKQSERKDAQAAAALEAGLPAAFASRLQGETPEELEADAKSLLEALPKAEPKNQPPHITATNPAGASGGLTQEQRDAQTRSWIKGGDSPFSQGGGYSINKE
jgi:hypothetical protein